MQEGSQNAIHRLQSFPDERSTVLYGKKQCDTFFFEILILVYTKYYISRKCKGKLDSIIINCQPSLYSSTFHSDYIQRENS